MVDRIVSVDDNFDLPIQTRNRLAASHGLQVVDPSFGDGITDATAEIQSKLTKAGAEGGIVVIPAGTFMKTAPLSIPDGVTVQGLGPGQTTVKNYMGGGDTVFRNANTAGGGGITVRDIRLDGLRHGGPEGSMGYSTLHFYGLSKRSFISNVHAIGGDRRILFPEPNSGRGECIELQLSDYVQLDNVYVEGAEYDGLKIRGGRFIQVNNFRAHNCTKGGLQMSANGTEEGLPDDISASYCTVTNALITHDTGVGLYQNPAITWHNTLYCTVIGLNVVGTGTAFATAGANVGARLADSVAMYRNEVGARPRHGSNVVLGQLDGPSPIHYAWWMGSNESIMTNA